MRDARGLRWLRTLPVVASPETVEEVFAVARTSTAWRSSTGESGPPSAFAT